jgi:hypothetical protein
VKREKSAAKSVFASATEMGTLIQSPEDVAGTDSRLLAESQAETVESVESEGRTKASTYRQLDESVLGQSTMTYLFF